MQLKKLAFLLMFPCLVGAQVYNPSTSGGNAVPTANWYVDSSIGNDSYPGTAGAPFATIRRSLADNQILYSQQFDVSTVWAANELTVVPNAAGVGDGTVDALIPTVASAQHQIQQSYSGPQIFSVCAGPHGYTALFLYAAGSGLGYNLSAGTTFSLSGITPFAGAHGMIPASTGTCGPQLVTAANWYRIWFVTTGGASAFTIGALNGTSGAISFAGDGTSGIYLWGAEANQNDNYNFTGPAYYLQTSGFPVNTLQSTQTLAIAGGSGNVYRESFYPSTSLTGLTITGYGSKRPVLAADDAIAASAWTLTSGTTYQATLALGTEGSEVNEWVNLFENGTLIYPMAASLVACKATPGSYFISGNGAGSIGTTFTLYYNPSAADNPSSNGKVYEYSKREYAFSYGANANAPIKISHLSTRRNIAANGSIQLGEGVLMDDVWALDGTKHNMFVGQNSTINNSGVIGAYFGNAGTSLIVGYEDTVSGGTLTINNFSCSNYLHTGIDIYAAQVGCMYAHEGAGSWGKATVNGLSATNVSGGLDGQFSAWDITNFTCYNVPQCLTVYNNPTTVTGSNLASNGQGPTIFVTGTDPATLTVTNSVLSGGNENLGVIDAHQPPITLTVTGSTITKSTAGGALFINGAVGSRFTFANNIFDVTYVAAYYSTFPLTSLSSNHNRFVRLPGINSGNAGAVNAVNYTLQGIQTTFGQELNSTFP